MINERQQTPHQTGNQVLPFAGIQYVHVVKISSLETPLLLANVIGILIHDPWAWLHTEHKKRRIIPMANIAMDKYDQVDSSFDIVLREDIDVHKKEYEVNAANSSVTTKLSSTDREGETEVKFLAQRHHQALHQPTGTKFATATPVAINGRRDSGIIAHPPPSWSSAPR